MKAPGFPKVVVILLALALAGEACGEKVELDSRWSPGGIQVDGRAGEWLGKLQELPGLGLAVAAINDGDYLYLAMVVSDHGRQRQILRGGVTTWLAPGNGKAPAIGIRYPSGFDWEGRAETAPVAYHGDQGPDLAPLIARQKNELQVLGPGEGEVYFLTPDAGAVLGALGAQGDSLVCELRVSLPRDASHPFGIGARPGDRVKVKVETPEMKGRMERGFGNRAPRGRRPGEGGGPPGEGEDRPAGERSEGAWGRRPAAEGQRPAGPPRRLDLQAVLRLAPAPEE
jgi:hypothetical protein